MVMKTSRPYVMRARADAADQTRARIVRAAVDLCAETMSLDFGLAEVAARAGTSVQTVLRHYGSRDGLLQAGQRLAQAEVIAERQVPAGDIAAAARTVTRHYERAGDWSLAMLARESRDSRVREVTDGGRQVHRAWVRATFAPQLARAAGDAAVLTDLLVVATDVYTWKLLRRDRGLSQAQVERRVLAMITAILGEEA
jgi:AcrR family transcriptional regulator